MTGRAHDRDNKLFAALPNDQNAATAASTWTGWATSSETFPRPRRWEVLGKRGCLSPSSTAADAETPWRRASLIQTRCSERWDGGAESNKRPNRSEAVQHLVGEAARDQEYWGKAREHEPGNSPFDRACLTFFLAGARGKQHRSSQRKFVKLVFSSGEISVDFNGPHAEEIPYTFGFVVGLLLCVGGKALGVLPLSFLQT
jgi:hypothetical protein